MAKRIGVLQLIKKAVLARSDRAGDTSNGGHRPSVEDPIDIPGLLIRGRPDRVVWGQGMPHILDLKTCAAGADMRPEHRRQLLSYAYLWHAETGIWPATATIQYVDGQRHTFDVSPAEARAVADEMTALLDRLNSDEAATAPESFASPSADACRWCPFKVACAPFFRSLTPEWGIYGVNLMGLILSVESSSAVLNLTLTNIAGDISEDITCVGLVGVPTKNDLAVGDMLAVVGADATRSPSTFRCTWETVLRVWEPAAVVSRS